MLKVQHITTGYGKKQVLTDISFEVANGEILLIGGNGSGKSTVLKTIYGLLKPWASEGKVFFEGHDITALPVPTMMRHGIVYMPQKKNVFEEFTVEENLLISSAIYPKFEAKRRVQGVYEMLPVLKTMQKRKPFYMSGGERQLLAFGIVLVHSPKMLLLDEPFAGVDAVYTEIIRKNVVDLANKGTLLVIVEHRWQLIGDFVSRVIELELGVIKKHENFGDTTTKDRKH
jgi:branched-chain amino acid transport system ATP-binding protein